MQITVVQIQAFVAVVDSGSFSAAAHELTMTQPAISHAIKSLERVLGGPVLHRHPLVAPTALGQKLLVHARATVSSAQSLVIAAENHFGQVSGPVRLAASTTACQGLVPDLLQHWRRELPDVTVQLLEGDDDEMLIWLEDGVVDAAILIDPAEPHEGSLVVARDHFHAVVRKDHPFAQLPEISVGDLIEEPLIVSNSSCLPQVMSMCRTAEPSFLPSQEVRELGTLMSMVAGHIGVSIMPSLAKPMLPKELTMVPLRPTLERNLVLTGPQSRPWNPLVEALTESLRMAQLANVLPF